MKMTRQHFQELANTCANILSCLDNRTDKEYDYQNFLHELIMSQFAALCSKSNPNFDHDKFVSWVEEKINRIEQINKQTQG